MMDVAVVEGKHLVVLDMKGSSIDSGMDLVGRPGVWVD